MAETRMTTKSFHRRAIIACLIGLIVLLLSCAAVLVFGLRASMNRESERNSAKMEAIGELMTLLRTDEKERSSLWMKENNERITVFMADSLREFLEGEEYTGPRMIGEGIVVELREDGVLYPEGMEEGYVSLFPSQVERMRGMRPEDPFLGFMTAAEEEEEHNRNWARVDGMAEDEDTIRAALFCGKISDRYYYVERTSWKELYEYVHLHAGYDDTLKAAEQAFDGAILNVDLDDGKLNNQSWYFPEVREASQLGFTPEAIEAKPPILVLGGTPFQVSYGSYSPTELLIYMHPFADLSRQNADDALLLGVLFLLILIAAACYLISVVRLVLKAEKTDLDNLRPYTPARLKRKLIAGGALGAILIFVFAALLQSLGMLYTETVSNTAAVNILAQELREREAERQAAVVEEEQNWYIYYGEQLAALLRARPEMGTGERLRAFCETMGIDYAMLFDENGKGIACSRDYYKFAMGTEEGGYLYGFRRLLMGVPSVREAAAADEINGEIHQRLGVTVPRRGGNPGALVMFLPHDLTHRALTSPDLDSHLRLLTAKGTFSFTADMSGTIVEDSEARYIGNTVMQYGLPESSLRDGYMSFLTMDGQQYYIVTVKRDSFVHFYVTEVSSLFGKSALYGLLAAAAFAMSFLVLAAGLMKGYRRRIFPAWASEALEREEDAPVRISSDHEKPYTRKTLKRWNSLFGEWRELQPGDKAREIICLGLCLLLLICLGANASHSQLSLLSYILTGDWTRGLNLFSLCAALTVVLLAFLVTYLFRRLLQLITRFQSGRTETICRLIYSFSEYLVVLVSLFFCLTYMGFPISAVLTSAGLATLALTWGAQGMIADILAGVAIVFEGDFMVGDIVELEGFWGRVEEIGIRTTKLVNTGNDVKIIENSHIKNLINKTRYYSVCVLTFDISKDESLPKVEALLEAELPKMREKHPEILSGPIFCGVSKVLDKTIIPYYPTLELLIVAYCKEENKATLTRELNRDLFLMFMEHGIKIE